MSLGEYKQSQLIAQSDYPFYALIMAAFRQADSANVRKLQLAFPETYREFEQRYDAPGGVLPGEVERLMEIIRDA